VKYISYGKCCLSEQLKREGPEALSIKKQLQTQNSGESTENFICYVNKSDKEIEGRNYKICINMSTKAQHKDMFKSFYFASLLDFEL
jgi:hypothetical protein